MTTDSKTGYWATPTQKEECLDSYRQFGLLSREEFLSQFAELMEKLNRPQTEIARIVKSWPGTVCQWKLGNKAPTPENRIKVLNLLRSEIGMNLLPEMPGATKLARDHRRAKTHATKMVADQEYCTAIKTTKKKNYDKTTQGPEGAKRIMLRSSCRRAAVYGVPFSISEQDIILNETCPILGIELKKNSGSGSYHYNSYSLDRIVPASGYVPGNVQVISSRANCLKSNATKEEMVLLGRWAAGEKWIDFLKNPDSDEMSRKLVAHAKYSSKKRSIEFRISICDIDVPAFCPILSIPLVTSRGRRQSHSPSLDRIDSSLGYIPGNVQVISWRANELKKNATRHELMCLKKWAENQV